MEKTTITIRGIAPMLMHNGQLADPTNEHTRALSAAVKIAKNKKTDAAHEAVKRAEFMGGLYLDEKHEPAVPGEMIEAMIVDGAKATRQGKSAKAGIIVDGVFPLQYKGPRSADELWANAGFHKTVSAKVGKNRIMRTRPMFTGWSLTFDVHFNPAMVSERTLREIIATAGAESGLGDWRPRYGRFEVVS